MSSRPVLRELVRLGLPLSHPGPAWLVAGLALGVYLMTMARGLTFYDSPELALVARELGVGHPIGQPVHTLLGAAFSRLPGLSPVTGLTAMSALFGALSALPMWSLSERLVPPGAWRGARVIRGAAVLGVLLSAVAWEPATRVEVYTLGSFLACWSVAFAGDVAERLAAGERAIPRVVGLGVALGAAAGTHAILAAGAGLACVPLLWNGDGWRRRALRAVSVTGGGLLGLTTYVYVPLASRDPHRFAWGGVHDMASFRAYLSGADYAHNQGIEGSGWLAHLGDIVGWWASHGALPVALVGAGAWFGLGRRTRGLRWAFLPVPFVHVGFVAANVVFHPDVPDYRGYYLPTLVLAGAGVAALAAKLALEGGRHRAYGVALGIVPLLAILVSPAHLGGPRTGAPSLAERMARGALREAPRNGILVAEADHWVAPLLYVQEVDGVRPDVVLVPWGLASSSWYWAHLRARHPSLRDFALRGPGGRAGRIGRLLEAHPERAVQLESWDMAMRLGRRPCGVGWLLHAGPGCAPPDPGEASAAVSAGGPYQGESLEVAAALGAGRGEAAWRLGQGRGAAEAWVAGLPASGVGPRLPEGLPERTRPLGGPLPPWTRHRPIHDPARNLALTGLLLRELGRPREALAFVDAARSSGLPGAEQARALVQR